MSALLAVIAVTLAVGITVLGLLAIWFGISELRREWRLLRRGKPARAVVVGSDSGPGVRDWPLPRGELMAHPVIRLPTEDGREIVTGVRNRLPAFATPELGAEVTVRFDPRNPYDAVIRGLPVDHVRRPVEALAMIAVGVAFTTLVGGMFLTPTHTLAIPGPDLIVGLFFAILFTLHRDPAADFRTAGQRVTPAEIPSRPPGNDPGPKSPG